MLRANQLLAQCKKLIFVFQMDHKYISWESSSKNMRLNHLFKHTLEFNLRFFHFEMDVNKHRMFPKPNNLLKFTGDETFVLAGLVAPLMRLLTSFPVTFHN